MPTTVVKEFGTTGTFSTPQLWEDGAPADLTLSQRWTAGTFVGTFTQDEVVTGTGITGGKFLDSDQSTYITFGTTTTPSAGITITGSSSSATCIISGTANLEVIWQGQGQNQEFSGAGTQLLIDGSTSSSTAYKEATTVAGASFRDHASVQTNALRYNAANGCGLKTTGSTVSVVFLGESNSKISKLQLSNTTTNGSGLELRNTFADFCVVEGIQTAVDDGKGILSFTGNGTVTNSIFINRASGADHIVGTSTTSPNLYNCTFVAADDLAVAPTSIFLSGASGTVTVQNCGLFAGDSTKAIKAGGATFNFTTCYSDIGVAAVTDVFTDTDGVTLPTHNSNWSIFNPTNHNSCVIQTNAARNAGVSANRYSGRTWANDQYVQAVVVTASDSLWGVMVRASTADALTCYIGGAQPGFINNIYEIWKVVAGVRTTVVKHASQTLTAGDVVRLEVSGTSLTLKVNGTTILGPTTDSAIASGQAGLILRQDVGTPPLLDDWSGNDTPGVTATTYANEFQNVNDATRDFRLKTGAAQIDTGTTDTTNAAIDIAKTARPSGAAYDVGAWEFVQGMSPGPMFRGS